MNKVVPYDEDETLYKFTLSEVITKNQESPTKRKNSSIYEVPKVNSQILQASRSELVNDDTIISLLNTIICGVSIIQHNILFENNYEQNENILKLRIIIAALAFSSTFWIIRRYKVKLMIKLITFKVSPRDTIFSTGLYKPMLLEILFALAVTPPYFDLFFSIEMLGYTIKYSFSAILVFFSVLKIYVLFRLFGHYSEYTQSTSHKICNKHSVDANVYFALKTYLEGSPFMGIGVFFLLMSVLSAIAMQLCEEPDREIDGVKTESSLKLFWDNLWVILYTTTTVGYGNLYPTTHLGRGICIIACILGNMYLGMLVVTIHKRTSLDQGQLLSYAWISRGDYSYSIKALAKTAIRKAVTLYLLSKKWKKKTISRIKPNGICTYKNIKLNNDLLSLTYNQYMTKLRLYRELKSTLQKFKELNRNSRNVGKNEIDILFDFEDAIRIDFPIFVRNLKKKIVKEDLDVTARFAKAFVGMEQKSLQVKEFTKMMRRKLGQAYRRRNTMVIRNDDGLKNFYRSLSSYSKH